MNQHLTLDITINAHDLLKSCLTVENGIEHWNTLMKDLFDRNLIEQVWHEEADEPRFIMDLQMETAVLSDLAMPHINLSPVYIENCQFNNCDLRGAELAICRGCSFRSCDLRGTLFSSYSDLTSSIFTGCIFDETTTIEFGLYDEGHPLIELPSRLFKKCKPQSVEVRKPLTKTRIVPIQAEGRLVIQ